jgi:hypothetical protein
MSVKNRLFYELGMLHLINQHPGNEVFFNKKSFEAKKQIFINRNTIKRVNAA